MVIKTTKAAKSIQVGILFAGIIAVSSARSLAAQGQQTSSSPVSKPASHPYVNQPPRISNREAAYLESVWGIADPSVKAVESGIILRFNYRVLDPAKAKVLEDKKFEPSLNCPDKGLSLVIPTMEKVGQLRQAPHTIDAGKTYWMAFSDSGRQIKHGDRVDVVIGTFRVEGIIVE
jgi:hypothetical protein